MSSTALKVIAVVMVLLAVVLGAVTVNVYRENAQRAQQAEAQAQAQQKAPQTLAVVAIKPLAAYKPIDPEAVALAPIAVAPANYFTNLDDVVAKVPLVDIDAGAPVTARYFKEGNVLARVIPQGYQAVSVEVNDVIAVGGFVRPGDIVDVLLFLRGGAGVTEPQSRVLLKEARVLAYEERIIDRPQGLKEDEKANAERRRTRTAVLAVPDADTTRVMLGASLGELRLALHGQVAPGEEQAAEASPGGLPLSAEAIAAQEAQKVPDKAVTVGELSRVKPPPVQNKKAPPPTVEVYRGSQRERVVTRN